MNTFSQGSCNTIPVPVEGDVFDKLKQCQARFNAACYAFQKAQEERESASLNLKKVSQDAMAAIQSSLQDPTVPAPAQTSNGRY